MMRGVLITGLILSAQSAIAESKSAAPEIPDGKYSVDTVHSSVVYRLLYQEKGYFFGRFNDVSGEFSLNTKEPEKSVFNIEIKADSVDTANKDRDDHLRSPDFFNAKQFPKITFMSKQVKKIANDRFEIAGEFKMLGKTRPATIELKLMGSGKDIKGNYRSGLYGEFTLKRSEFGMKKSLDSLGDEISVYVGLQGIKKS